MTTLPPVSAGNAAATLEAQAPHLDDGKPAHVGMALGDGSAAIAGARGGADAIALFTASHEMHPLVPQQAYVKQAGTQGTEIKAKPQVVPDAATRNYDVRTTSQADIEALKNSPDKQQQRLGHTIENLKASYGDLLDSKKVNIHVTMNAANGGEPVATIASAAFDPTKSTRVHTHYHGDNATIGDPVGSKAGQASRIREIIARDPQTVFVLPECQNATPTVDGPKSNNSYPASWGNVKSQAETTDIALRAAGANTGKVVQETVSLHSRGGEVIQNLMAHDKTGNSLRADRLELLDCLYGSPPSVVAWGKTENGKHVSKVIYVQGTNVASGYGDDKEIAKTFKGSYIRIDIAKQKPLNDQNNPVVYDGKDAARHDHVKGEKNDHATRQFNTDRHYQTTGRFMGMWPLPLANG
jgi:hypothetical protein